MIPILQVKIFSFNKPCLWYMTIWIKMLKFSYYSSWTKVIFDEFCCQSENLQKSWSILWSLSNCSPSIIFSAEVYKSRINYKIKIVLKIWKIN